MCKARAKRNSLDSTSRCGELDIRPLRPQRLGKEQPQRIRLFAFRYVESCASEFSRLPGCVMPGSA